MLSVGREAVELAASAGLYVDPWQEFVIDNAMSIRSDGKWCHTDVGVMVSRQNGKGAILEVVELWGLFINEETIIHTAHNHKTSLEHFRRMESLIRSAPELAAEVLRFSHNNNDRVIELRNGARLLFGTRTKGTARGLTIDRVVCDEAMYLTEEHMNALGPTTAAVPNAQIWFTGSAGVKESTEFGRMRARAMDGTHPSLFYAEWSIDAHNDFCTFDCEAHDDPHIQESWAKANPGLGNRIALDYIESRSKSMSTEAFQQEHLGVGDWPVDGDEWKIISNDSWNACADRLSQAGDTVVLAVDTTPDRKYSCIAVAGGNDYDQTHVEITNDGEQYDHRAGTQWVVPAIVDMWKLIKPSCVMIMKSSPAATFIRELEDAGVKVVSPTAAEYSQACGDFYSSVVPRKGERITLSHLGQPMLNAALAGADKRDLADGWAWSRKDSATDISPLVSATLAVWGYRNHGHIKTAAPWVAFGGRVVS